jgi:UTP--glucose-1-phosphate uridylyltransferase
MDVKIAVIPAAGFGTRFLPITKSIPKEMLPIVDKPIIQIVVEELVDAGIKEIIIVTKGDKKSLENYFKPNPKLDKLLRSTGKEEAADSLRRIEQLAKFRFIKQVGKSGNAVPIENSLKYIGKEPFLVFWGDDFVVSKPSRAKQLIEAYKRYKGVVLGAIRTSKEEDAKKYGFAKGRMISKKIMEVSSVIEKPGPGNAPSEIAIVSGFLITPEAKLFFAEDIKEVIGREPCYLDAIDRMIKAGKGKCYALELSNAKYFDTGSKLGYLQAVIDFGLKNKEYGEELKEYIAKL